MKRLIILILIAVCASCGVETINCTNYLCEVDKVLGTQVRQYHNKSYYNATPIEKDITAILARGTMHGLPGIIYPTQGQGDKYHLRKGCEVLVIGKSYQGGTVFKLSKNCGRAEPDWIMYTRDL